MKTIRTRVVAPLAIVIALALTPALSACSAVEGIIEGATGGNVQLSGTDLPEGFPTEVPLVSGEIQFGGFVESDGSKVFNVTIKVTGDSPSEAIASAFTDAGFTVEGSAGDPTAAAGALFKNDNWGVAVAVAGQSPDWIVNYTVTSATP